jgi:hypothetical protein
MPDTHGNNPGEGGTEGEIPNPGADDALTRAMMLEMVNRLSDLEARLAEMQGSSSQREIDASERERAKVENYRRNMSVLSVKARQVGTVRFHGENVKTSPKTELRRSGTNTDDLEGAGEQNRQRTKSRDSGLWQGGNGGRAAELRTSGRKIGS